MMKDGLERYRSFNAGRAEAFDEAHGRRHPFPLPPAALGHERLAIC